MYIKTINNVEGYKGLPNGFSTEFDEDVTYIIGANFQRKSTVGSLFNWCLTGLNLQGKEREQVANDNIKVANVVVDITFVDNLGIEHRLIRNKGKDMKLILDGKEIEQEKLAQFYQDQEIFLVSHNPYYFAGLEPKEQKDLLRRILPNIDEKEIFNNLDKSEQEIIGEPIESLSLYIEKKNAEISELKEQYERNLGTLQAYKNIALRDEGELLVFENEQELLDLQEKYEAITANFENSSVEDIQRQISRINERLKEILKIKLAEIMEKYNREEKKLQDIKNKQSICPSCRQEIKEEEVKKHLINFQIKELQRLQDRANGLKEDAKKFVNERKRKIEILEQLNNPDTQEALKQKEKIKSRMDILQQERSNILLHNKEVQVRKEQVREAKQNINILDKVQEEIIDSLELVKKQKKIANKMKILVIETQKEQINRYLNRVSIQFSKVNKTTGEIVECCNIQYEGRDYKKLSKSQQIRACLEISNVFNNLSGIKAPLFLDDAESTTDIGELSNTQIIISLVIKYNPLEILYDYSDVLQRRKKSIEREIEEKSSYVIELAA